MNFDGVEGSFDGSHRLPEVSSSGGSGDWV